jgi:hypothetical protein
VIFYKMLVKRHPTKEDQVLKCTAVMLSWGIYGASVEWRKSSQKSPEDFITIVIPSILYGIDFE